MQIKLIAQYVGPMPCVHVCDELSPGIFRVEETIYGTSWENLREHFLSRGYYKSLVNEAIPRVEITTP